MSEFATFTKFQHEEEAQSFLALLDENNIPYKIRRERNQIDPIIIGSTFDAMVAVDVPVDLFSRVSQLVKSVTVEKPLEEYYPERLATQWIVLGYILSTLSLIGLFSALAVVTGSKRLSDGRKVKIYDDYTLRHGRIMIFISVVSTVVLMLNKMGML